MKEDSLAARPGTSLDCANQAENHKTTDQYEKRFADPKVLFRYHIISRVSV